MKDYFFDKFTGRNKCTTYPIRGKRIEKREKTCIIVKISSLLSPLSSLLFPSNMRESKAYRRVRKSAINYVHLLIFTFTNAQKRDLLSLPKIQMSRIINIIRQPFFLNV
jgi:hypothetical protein